MRQSTGERLEEATGRSCRTATQSPHGRRQQIAPQAAKTTITPAGF